MKFISKIRSIVENLQIPVTIGSTDPIEVPVDNTLTTNANTVETKKKRLKKSVKSLHTCDKCGHYRFAKTNGRRIVNPNYPYEHSSKGLPCPVEQANRIPLSDQLKRLCECSHCVLAATKSHHNPPRILKYETKIPLGTLPNYQDDKRTDKLFKNFLRNEGFYQYRGKWFKQSKMKVT